MINGLFETHLNVRSLDESVKFYENTLGLLKGRYEKERRAAFFWIGRPRRAMLGLWETKEAFRPGHFAFTSDPNKIIRDSQSFFEKRKIEWYNFLGTKNGPPLVFSWMPALSIYFKDPDDNELELLGVLPHDPQPDLGIVTYEDWMSVNTKR
jgi:lactoylglutathione lyase